MCLVTMFFVLGSDIISLRASRILISPPFLFSFFFIFFYFKILMEFPSFSCELEFLQVWTICIRVPCCPSILCPLLLSHTTIISTIPIPTSMEIRTKTCTTWGQLHSLYYDFLSLQARGLNIIFTTWLITLT